MKRKEAIKIGLTQYFTSKPCKFGHVNYRRTDSGRCITCVKIYADAHNKTAYYKNKIFHLKRNQEYRIVNSETLKEYNKQYYATNKETVLKYGKQWRHNNPDKIGVYRADRDSREKRATPVWYTLEKEQIKLLYQKRDELSQLLNCNLEVDHIIPLKSKDVCGLHCIANLQLLEKGLNASRGKEYTKDW